ncbi:MAG: DUF3558 family protein [Corynebacterium casei]|uniref:DUF3558 family protein n=1 Tax=Corynebacterium casei TaxID=160386 RepID=UPI003F9153A7
MHLLRKLRHTGILFAAGAILTGCTINIGGETTGAAPESVVPESSTELTDENTDLAAAAGDGIEVEPVIPPLGEFDRSDPDYVQYKPCLEIPDDFLEKAGLHGKEMSEGVGEVDGICTFDADPEHGEAIFKLQGSRHDHDAYLGISGDVSWDETSYDDAILIHRSQYLSDSECQAAVETMRGTFSVTFQSFEYGSENYAFDPCNEAQKKLKAVLELDGKHEN